METGPPFYVVIWATRTEGPAACGAKEVPFSGAPNENIVQNHLNKALLNVL